jgi:hypothetical protein
MLKQLASIVNSNTHKKLYEYAETVSYILLFIAFTGVFAISPKYLNTLDTLIKYYVCGFLLLRFNPWVSKTIRNKPESAEFDRRIAFSAGVFLLLSTAFTDIAQDYMKHIKDNIKNQLYTNDGL